MIIYIVYVKCRVHKNLPRSKSKPGLSIRENLEAMSEVEIGLDVERSLLFIGEFLHCFLLLGGVLSSWKL